MKCCFCQGEIKQNDYCVCTRCRQKICPSCARKNEFVCENCGGDIAYLS